MNDHVGTVDFYLKYDHRKHKLIVYIYKLKINIDPDLIKKASLKFTLLPRKEIKSSLKKSRKNNMLYFIYDDRITFKDLDAAKIGTTGLIVELISHTSIFISKKIADNYQPLDNLDLTSDVSRITLKLTLEQVNYVQEHENQTSRLLNRQSSIISINSYSSQDPQLAVTFKLHLDLSRLDVYIHRLMNINLFVSSGILQAGLVSLGSQLLSVNESSTIKFSENDLVHMTLILDLKEINVKDSGAFIQVIPTKKRDIKSDLLKYQLRRGVLHVLFGLESFTSNSSQLAWFSLCNGMTDLNNRWHKFIIGSLDIQTS